MTNRAERLNGNKWLVTLEADGVQSQHEVFAKETDTETDVLTSTLEALQGASQERLEQIAASKPPRNLTKPEFEFLLGSTGLDDVWAALENQLKQAPVGSPSKAFYGLIKAQRVQSTFRLEVTLQYIATVQAMSGIELPDVDLSVESITAAWVDVAENGIRAGF